MRAFLVPVIVAASLAALPALAQNNSSTDNSSNTNAAASMQNSLMSADKIEQKLRGDLSNAGYTDIQIVPGSFLVSAKDSDGQPTQLMVSPHSVVAMTSVPQSGQPGSTGGSGSPSNNTAPK